MSPRRLDEKRRTELIDALMELIFERGFTSVSTSEIAKELKCSVTTLYKLSPSKEGLIVLGIRDWGQRNLEDIERRTAHITSPSEHARAYYLAGADKVHLMTPQFHADIARFDSTNDAWFWLSSTYVGRFVELVEAAVDAGEVRPINVRFLGELLMGMRRVTSDERALRESGLTPEESLLLVDTIIWDGLLAKEPC